MASLRAFRASGIDNATVDIDGLKADAPKDWVREKPANLPEGSMVFHAGTGQVGADFVTAGGRVLGVTGRGPTVAAAIARAYEGVAAISWDGVHYRSDIGKKALGR